MGLCEGSPKKFSLPIVVNVRFLQVSQLQERPCTVMYLVSVLRELLNVLLESGNLVLHPGSRRMLQIQLRLEFLNLQLQSLVLGCKNEQDVTK